MSIDKTRRVTFYDDGTIKVNDKKYRLDETCHIVMYEPGWWECDKCGASIDWDSYNEDDPPNCAYCPNCGRKVVE